MRYPMGLRFVLAFATVFQATFLPAQSVEAGPRAIDARRAQDWMGVRTAGERSQEMVLHIQLLPRTSGTVDLPNFGALGIPAAKLSVAGGQIHFELVDDASTTAFDGVVKRDEISGRWQEGERSGDFRLRFSREIEPKWQAKEVTFKNGDVSLAGTLLLPNTTAPSAAIVFVHGAGPETRQASLFLAQHFAQRNMAALIYDKRGTGQSTGDWKHASFEDLASDVEAAVRFLKSQPNIDERRIGLMGSSQGGWIAPMAALNLPDLAFVIVKSAAAVSPEQQELARVGIQMQTAGESPADVAEAQRLYKNLIAYARSGQGWESVEKEIKSDATKRWALLPANTPRDYWFFDQIRLFFGHDPLTVLKQLKTPLLVVFGGRDDDGPPLASQLSPLLTAMESKGKVSQLAVFPNAGHGLRVEPGPGEPWDFPTFAPGYLQLLDRWVSDCIGAERIANR